MYMDLFTKHYPRKGKLEESAYYYWYLYMQRLDGYGRRHRLWKDFGGVNMPFWDWWRTHEELFRTGAKYGVLELKTDAEIREARSEGAYVVRIDPECTREYLMRYFREFLDEKKIHKGVGRRKHQDEVKYANYPFYKRPDVKSLRISLDVWNLRHQQPKPTLYEIGVKLKLCPNHVINDKKDVQAVQTDKMNVMNATVSRYLRRAETTLLYIGGGLFPVNKYEPSSYDPNIRTMISDDDSRRKVS